MSSVMISRPVGRVPDVSQGHGRVEPVEDAQRQRHVLDDGPHRRAVELLLAHSVPVGLGFQGVPDVKGKVGHQ